MILFEKISNSFLKSRDSFWKKFIQINSHVTLNNPSTTSSFSPMNFSSCVRLLMFSALGPFLLLSHVRMEAEFLRSGGGVKQLTLTLKGMYPHIQVLKDMLVIK